VRPKLEIHIERNGNSVKVFELGKYLGSIPMKKLVELVKRFRPDVESTQVSASAEGAELLGFQPKT
jgi:hypothetical protein